MSDAARLDGWKAVADHLGRDVRTAQRWHRQRGMPVHHVPGNRGGAVFAYPSELDQWLAAGAIAQQRSRTLETPSPDIRPETSNQGATESPAPGRHRIRVALAFAASLLLLATLATARLIRNGTAHQSTATHAEVDGATLSALDAKNNVLWTYELPDARVAAQAGVQPALDRALPVDINADGLTELVATIHYSQGGRFLRDAEVYCFTSEGALLWRYRPTLSLTFADHEFSGPWRAYGAAVSGGSVWLSFIDRTWWPSIVVSLSVDGKERLAFVNAGHIEALQGVKAGDRPLMLAGGFNNEFMLPAMAALDTSGPAASSPQTRGTPFVCDNCPTGHPWRYFVFAPSDVAAAMSRGFATVTEIERNERDGVIDVSVRDGAHVGRAVYRLAPDLMPQSVGFSDAYWTAHQEMSAAGKIDHPSERCPARSGVIVRVWQPATGWQDVAVGPTFASKKPN